MEQALTQEQVRTEPTFWQKHRGKIIVGLATILITLTATLLWATHNPAKAAVVKQIPESAEEIQIPLPVPQYSQEAFIELVTQIMRADGFEQQKLVGWEEQRWTRKVDGGEQTFCLYGTHTGLTVYASGIYTSTLSTYRLITCQDLLSDRCAVSAP